MSTSATAALAAISVALLKVTDANTQIFSSPPIIPKDVLAISQKTKATTNTRNTRQGKKTHSTNRNFPEDFQVSINPTRQSANPTPKTSKDQVGKGAVFLTPTPPVQNRTLFGSNKRKDVGNGEMVMGDWQELPHNMGPVVLSTAQSADTFLPPLKRARKDNASNQAVKVGHATRRQTLRARANNGAESTLDPSDVIKTEPGVQQLKEQSPAEFKEYADVQKSAKWSRSKASKQKSKAIGDPSIIKITEKPTPQAKKTVASNDGLPSVGVLLDKLPQKLKKPKKNPYGLTPGETPFPDFSMPIYEACNDVNELLSEAHGKVEPPKTIPPPSLEITGCGEVPSVLDALIRTRLSAATTGTNSAYAFAGIVAKYGIRETGIGQGSVDWNQVRDGKVGDLEIAIKRGGLAKSKSVSIKAILDMVYEQNVARHDAFLKEKETGEHSGLVGADRLEQGQKDMEIAVADQHVLSLDYMHGLTSDEAMVELTKFPGIGVKTASCVILFCLRRPSFAVDTHVWRMCKWLKWVPDGATRDQTFSHCEVRVPDDLKYSLHQLFIRHGKTCGRCRAATGETSEAWAKTVCPIEHLVERTGKRKGLVRDKKQKTLKKSSSKNWESDDEMDDAAQTEEQKFDHSALDSEAVSDDGGDE